MPHVYDPAREPGNPNYMQYRLGIESVPPAPPGPGGATINVENNEKGIQETELFDVMRQNPTRSPLRSRHDGFRQGIYTTNSPGDMD